MRPLAPTRLLRAVAALSLAAAFVSACRVPPSAPPPADTVRIGVLTYTGGQGESCCGTPMREALRLVRAEVEAAGGVVVAGRRMKVEFVERGFTSSPEEAAAHATALVSREGVSAILGPNHSGDAIAAGGVAEAAGVPLLSPMSTNPRTTAGRRFVFRAGFTDNLQAAALARFAREELGLRTAAVLYDVSEPYSRGMAEGFRERFAALGGRVTSFESYLAGDNDFRPGLAAVAKAKPDLLLLPNHNNLVPEQGRQARAAGIRSVLLGGDGWNEQILPTVPAFHGAFKSAHWASEIPTAENRAFLERYRKEFGRDPVNAAALTYDGARMLLAALGRAASAEPGAVRDALASLPAFRGASGEIHYAGSGDPVKPVIIQEFRGGKAVFRASITP